jgi:hypothetical protein
MILKNIAHTRDKQVLEDPLTKSISPSALREHMCNMGLWHTLRFRTIKGPKAK